MSVFLAEKRTYARKARRGLIYNDITQTIGNTPVVKLGRLIGPTTSRPTSWPRLKASTSPDRPRIIAPLP